MLRFLTGHCLLRFNQNGGIYDHGRHQQQILPKYILDLHHLNFSQRDIAEHTLASKSFVQKVVARYEKENTSLPAVKKHRHAMRAEPMTFFFSQYGEIYPDNLSPNPSAPSSPTPNKKLLWLSTIKPGNDRAA